MLNIEDAVSKLSLIVSRRRRKNDCENVCWLYPEQTLLTRVIFKIKSSISGDYDHNFCFALAAQYRLTTFDLSGSTILSSKELCE